MMRSLGAEGRYDLRRGSLSYSVLISIWRLTGYCGSSTSSSVGGVAFASEGWIGMFG
jgi:hypothetical protein